MDLKGQKVKVFKNGKIIAVTEIVKHIKKNQDCTNDIVELYINEVKKSYKLVAFCSGLLKLLDEDLQKKIEDIICESALEFKNIVKPESKILIRRYANFGNNANNAYKKLCNEFGFDNSKMEQFGGKGRPLYANNAIKEGYGVWFIAHSNLTETIGGQWENVFSNNEKIITETWTGRLYQFYGRKGEKRLVFAKRNGEYKFFGIYKCIEYDYVVREKIYERICENYPESQDENIKNINNKVDKEREMKLCPICKKNYMYDNEKYCSDCNFRLKLIENLTTEQLVELIKKMTKPTVPKPAPKPHINKNEALSILRNNGYEMEKYATTFASKNDTINIYWANPSYSMLQRNWYLILNDTINRRLYVFKIPAGSGLENRLISRADLNDKIDLQIYYNDFTFTDSRSKISFSKYYVGKVDY